MLDAYWLQAWEAMEAHVGPRDRLLLPSGDWPASPAPQRHYHRTIHVGDATIFALHKGRVSAATKPLLRGLVKRWDVIFANEVFVCFRKPDSPLLHDRPECDHPHVRVVQDYLSSHRRKRIPYTVWFAHLPKTGGTSLWESLSESVASFVYYDSFETFLARPPRREEFDLIGGHIPLPIIMKMAGPDDIVVGLVREPVARMRSAFLHSRRADEDAMTFSPLMRALREHSLSEIMRTVDGGMEARQQSIMLGFDFAREYLPDEHADIVARATALLGDSRCRFDITDRIGRLAAELSMLLHIPELAAPIRVRNASPPHASADDEEMFETARPEILAAVTQDRMLYDLVSRCADARAARLGG